MLSPKKSPSANMDPVTMILYPELEQDPPSPEIEHFADLASGMLETTRTREVDTSRNHPRHQEVQYDEHNLTHDSDMFSPRFGGAASPLSLEERKIPSERVERESPPEEEVRRLRTEPPVAIAKIADRDELINFLKCSQSPLNPYAHPLSLMKQIDQVKAIEQGNHLLPRKLPPPQPHPLHNHHIQAESFGAANESSVQTMPFNEPLDSPHNKSIETPSDRSKKRHISVIDLLPSIHQAGPPPEAAPEEVIYEAEDEGILGYKLLIEMLTTLDCRLLYNAFVQFLTVKDCLRLSETNRQLSKAITRRTMKRVIRLGNLDPELRQAFWIYQAPFFTIQQNVRIRLNLGDIFDNVYDRLIERIEPSYEEAIGAKQMHEIERDVNRTFDKFKGTSLSGAGHQSLFRILAAMAYVLPDIGYCQGMNFIAGALLEQLEDEEEAFWIMLSLIINKKMKKLLIPGVPSLHMRIYQMIQLMEKHVPELLAHFKSEEIGIDYFTTKWIMTIFTSFFSFESLPPVLDYFFLDGWKGIFKMAIAILKYLHFEFISMDLLAFARFFRQCKAYPFNMRVLLELAADVKITNRELNKMTELFYIREAEAKLELPPDPAWPKDMERAFKRLRITLEGLEHQAKETKALIKKELSRHDQKLQGEQALLRDANQSLSKVNQEFKQVLTEKEALEITLATLKEELVYAKEDAKAAGVKKLGFWKNLFGKKKKQPHTAGPSVEKGDIVDSTRLQMQTEAASGKLKKKIDMAMTEGPKTSTARQQEGGGGGKLSPRKAISPPSQLPPAQTLYTEMPKRGSAILVGDKVRELEKQVREIEKKLKKALVKYGKLKKDYERRLTDFNDKSIGYEEVRQKKEALKDELNKTIITLELKKQDLLKDMGERIQDIEDAKCTISF